MHSPLSSVKSFNCSESSTSRSDDVGALEGLGLTGRQARVYLALLRVGEAKAKAIADLSLVNRQEIYRILDDLQQMGIVQKNISCPITFTAAPITTVVNMLLAQKTAELTIIRKKTKQLTKKLQNNPALKGPAKRPYLGTVFESDRGERYCQAIQATRQNIKVVTVWRRFKQGASLLETFIQQSLQNGVTIHVATDKPPRQPLPAWITNNPILRKNDQLKLKILQTQPTATIAIFDQTTTAIAFDPDTSITKGPALWTTNPTLTTLSQAYFNNIWTQTPIQNLPNLK